MYIDHVFRFFLEKKHICQKDAGDGACSRTRTPQIRVSHALSYCAILLVDVKVLSASAVSFNQTSDDDM